MRNNIIIANDRRFHLTKDCISTPMCFGKSRLHQIGRLFCNADTKIDRHCQLNYLELTAVTGGLGVALVNGKKTELKKGDIHIVFPGDFHEIITDKQKPLEFDYISISTECEEYTAEIERILLDYHDESKRIINDGFVLSLIGRINAEINESNTYSQKMTECLLDELFITIIRDYESIAAHRHAKELSDAQMLVYEMMNYIDTHIYTMKNLRELSLTMRYNYNYLSNLYKEITAKTLMSYYQDRRLETARLLLSRESLSVTEVAGMLNYSSLYTFSRAYKNKYGVSPSGKSR